MPFLPLLDLQLVLSNFTYVGVLSGMSFVVTLLGKVSVTALCTFVAFAWLEFDKSFQYGGGRELNSIWLPLLVGIRLPLPRRRDMTRPPGASAVHLPGVLHRLLLLLRLRYGH